MSESVVPLSTNHVQLSRGAMSRSKSAECSLDSGDHVTPRRPTTPITYTNLLSWRRGKPEVYVINDAGHSSVGHMTQDDRRSSTGSKRSSRHERGKVVTSDETLTSFEQSSAPAAAAVGENHDVEIICWHSHCNLSVLLYPVGLRCLLYKFL